MTKHTPGPWVYRPGKHDDWGWVRTAAEDEDGIRQIVACARSGRFETDRELECHRRNKTDPYEANARLIAAAPDLLAALKGVVAIADRKTVEFDIAHAAIAKAEGKSLTAAERGK